MITFEDLPDTTTPITADNLNNNFEELETTINNLMPAYIRLVTSGTQTFDYNVFKKVEFTIGNNVGNVFLFDTTTDILTIPAGITAVRIGGCVAGRRPGYFIVRTGSSQNNISSNTNSAILCQDESYWRYALPGSILEFDDATVPHYIQIVAEGYKTGTTFDLNSGFTGGTQVYIERVR